MSFLSLLDYTVRIRRATKVQGALGSESMVYPAVAVVPATCKRTPAPLGDAGPGIAAIGERRWYLPVDADVRERDVLEPLTGPDLEHNFEVDGPVTRPRNHHVEVKCRHFIGVLEPVEES